MRQQFGAFIDEMVTSPQQIPRGTQRGWIDVGLRQGTPTEQDVDFVGIDLIVFGFASMDGFHVKGVPKDKSDAFSLTQIC